MTARVAVLEPRQVSLLGFFAFQVGRRG